MSRKVLEDSYSETSPRGKQERRLVESDSESEQEQAEGHTFLLESGAVSPPSDSPAGGPVSVAPPSSSPDAQPLSQKKFRTQKFTWNPTKEENEYVTEFKDGKVSEALNLWTPEQFKKMCKPQSLVVVRMVAAEYMSMDNCDYKSVPFFKKIDSWETRLSDITTLLHMISDLNTANAKNSNGGQQKIHGEQRDKEVGEKPEQKKKRKAGENSKQTEPKKKRKAGENSKQKVGELLKGSTKKGQLKKKEGEGAKSQVQKPDAQTIFSNLLAQATDEVDQANDLAKKKDFVQYAQDFDRGLERPDQSIMSTNERGALATNRFEALMQERLVEATNACQNGDSAWCIRKWQEAAKAQEEKNALLQRQFNQEKRKNFTLTERVVELKAVVKKGNVLQGSVEPRPCKHKSPQQASSQPPATWAETFKKLSNGIPSTEEVPYNGWKPQTGTCETTLPVMNQINVRELASPKVFAIHPGSFQVLQQLGDAGMPYGSINWSQFHRQHLSTELFAAKDSVDTDAVFKELLNRIYVDYEMKPPSWPMGQCRCKDCETKFRQAFLKGDPCTCEDCKTKQSSDKT